MAIDVNALIRRAKTLSNGVHGAVNVGQGLRNVPADKHYSAGQMKAFAMQCTRIAEAVMGLPDDGRGNRAEANRVFASAGGAFYDLAGNITGTAHQFSFEIANSPDKLIVIGIKVLERMASGKSAKAAAVVAAAKAVGTKQDVPQLVQKTAQNISAGIKRLLPEIEAAGDQWVEDRSILRAIEMWGPIWAKAWASVMRDAKQSGDYIPNAATISQMLYQVETLRGSATQHFNRILKLLSQARV